MQADLFWRLSKCFVHKAASAYPVRLKKEEFEWILTGRLYCQASAVG